MPDLTETHKVAQARLAKATVRDLLKLWPALDLTRLDATYPAWETAVTALIARNRTVSVGLAASYLRAFRAQHVDLADFIPLQAPAASPEQVATVLRVTSVVSVKNAMLRGEKLAVAAQKAFVLSSGEASRLVLDGGRQTVVDTVRADPKATGWQRVPSGSACAFCRLLAGRGAVYKEDTVDFASHGHCHCTVAPEYGDLRTVRDYVPSTRNLTDVDRARVRKWLAEHPDA